MVHSYKTTSQLPLAYLLRLPDRICLARGTI